MQDIGRLLLVFGVLLAVIGGALMLFGRFHLPGDLMFRSGGVTIYVPIDDGHHPFDRAHRGPERGVPAPVITLQPSPSCQV
ncbi:MAG: DUF2905 domain-containing protein [Candidatus Dormibacteraceae bacterium]